MAHIPQSDDHAPAVQAAATTNSESTKALILYYESQGIESSMTINWRPTNVNDLLELAQNAFPIPPSVAFVAVDGGCSWPILTPSIWQSRRLEIEKVNIIPLAVGYPIESGYRFPITIKSLTGRDYIITVNSMHTVASVMLEIEAAEGIPFDSIRLLYKGRPLSFGESVIAYGIQENDIVHLVLKLRGGKPVIYLFSPRPRQVHVSLSLAPSWSFSAVYPIKTVNKTDQGDTIDWKVVTRADGTLLDSETGSDVAYLYWEALTNASYRVKAVTPPSSRPCSPHPASTVEVFEPGQPVLDPGNAVLFPIGNIPKYLDKVLLVLGLHTEARTSFITYWLPDMMKYPNIALRFLPQAAYEKAAPLNVQPSPTTTTRVFMLWCGVDTSDASEGGQWTEAIVRGKMMELTKWREVVGTSGAILKDEKGDLRLLEWGGMEIK
ncbi:hypothetical protein FRC17_009252 [Serendipita sp. 399]|nr:hypothetical protein FRC17_009252 [Serendipita sp. 399]